MSEIPEAAVQAAGEALKRYMVGDDYDLERVPPDVPLDAADGWVSAIDGAAKDAMPAVLIAALPHLLTDEMVERAWGAYSEPGDDASEAEELDAMRHALEAALGGTA
jgi:hypothetical protein